MESLHKENSQEVEDNTNDEKNAKTASLKKIRRKKKQTEKKKT